MSTAAATADAASPKKSAGKKKLVVMLAIVLLVLAVAGGAAVVLLKKKARAAEEADGDAPAQVESERHHDAKNAPTFVPLDMFTVNLADREAERYAQVGVTLEVDDAHVGDEIKAYMPAIRSNVLMVLAQKSSQDLLDPEGKKRLAFEIKREASRAMGIEIEDEARPAGKGASSAEAPARKRKRPAEPSPIRQVHFSNFIIQ